MTKFQQRLAEAEVVRPFGDGPWGQADEGVSLGDFRAFMPTHQYIFMPNGALWPATSVNARVSPQPELDRRGKPVLDDEGKEKFISASAWLDREKAVEDMTWAPGEPKIVEDRLVSLGGWIARPGCSCFNGYIPPRVQKGVAGKAQPWVDHVLHLYPEQGEHIIDWLARRVQKPGEKINHALVLGGSQGIGKDTMLAPVVEAVGPWNCQEVAPTTITGRFNGYVKSVILRISEARDLGDADRFSFYDKTKTLIAAPPDMLRVDEKHVREYYVPNCCGVIITTNYKTDGIYLPVDDRRHLVAWSEVDKDQLPAGFFAKMHAWFQSGGHGHVAAFLRERDLSHFDPKAPPPKTQAFWAIVDANRAPEDRELADALDQLGQPQAVTIAQILQVAVDDFHFWLKDRRNSRQIPHRMEECGYEPVRNGSVKDGLWKIGSKRVAIYARKDLLPRDRFAAAAAVARAPGGR